MTTTKLELAGSASHWFWLHSMLVSLPPALPVPVGTSATALIYRTVLLMNLWANTCLQYYDLCIGTGASEHVIFLCIHNF